MAEQKIQGKENAGRWENEADKVTASRMKPVYDSKTIVVPGGGYADFSVKALASPMFTKFARAHTIIVRTNADMSFKLNSVADDAVDLLAAEGVVTLDIVEMQDVFLTAPAGATIKIILV